VTLARELPAVTPGDTLADRFEVIQFLGTGVIGQVYLAADRTTNSRVALKFPRYRFRELPGLAATGSAHPLAPFLRRESHLTAHLRHPGIVEYIDSGELAGIPWLATAYLPLGLADSRQVPMDIAGTMEVLRPVTDALTYLHSRGFVHRDLTPKNVRINDDGLPVLIDFGLAQRIGDRSWPTVDRILGTPLFSPPECHRHDGLTISLAPNADVFSIARLFEWMLVGAHIRPHPDTPISTIPDPLRAIVQQATSSNPLTRPDTPAKFLRSCELALGELGEDAFLGHQIIERSLFS